MATIVIFGDSIAWGAADAEHGGWANLLRNKYASEFDDCLVYNLGISGNTSRDVLQRFSVECAARSPDIVLFAVGMNDAAYEESKSEYWIPLEDFRQNMKKVIKNAQEVAGDVGVLGLIRVDESKTSPVPWWEGLFYENDAIGEYDKVLQGIAEQLEVPYLPLAEVLTKDELTDGLHPNTAGHKKLFVVIEKFVAENFL